MVHFCFHRLIFILAMDSSIHQSLAPVSEHFYWVHRVLLHRYIQATLSYPTYTVSTLLIYRLSNVTILAQNVYQPNLLILRSYSTRYPAVQ